jgi:hypothetical protein
VFNLCLRLVLDVIHACGCGDDCVNLSLPVRMLDCMREWVSRAALISPMWREVR